MIAAGAIVVPTDCRFHLLTPIPGVIVVIWPDGAETMFLPSRVELVQFRWVVKSVTTDVGSGTSGQLDDWSIGSAETE